MPFFSGETGLFYKKQKLEEKYTKPNKTNPQQIRTVKAKWGGSLCHFTWPLDPHKNKQENKKNKTKQIRMV